MERVRLYATFLARKSVIGHMEKDGGLALKYLERKRKKEFSPRAEYAGSDGEPIRIVLSNFKGS